MKLLKMVFTVIIFLCSDSLDAQDTTRQQRIQNNQILENEKVNQKPANGDTARIWKNNIAVPIQKDAGSKSTPMRTDTIHKILP